MHLIQYLLTEHIGRNEAAHSTVSQNRFESCLLFPAMEAGGLPSKRYQAIQTGWAIELNLLQRHRELQPGMCENTTHQTTYSVMELHHPP